MDIKFARAASFYGNPTGFGFVILRELLTQIGIGLNESDDDRS